MSGSRTKLLEHTRQEQESVAFEVRCYATGALSHWGRERMSIQTVWQRWRDLTRFRLACEMALAAYRTTFAELPFRNIAEATVFDQNGPTRFECSHGEFLDALQDDTRLYQLLLVAHASLVEEFGRVVVSEIVDQQLAPRSAFPGLDPATNASEAADDYIRRCNVEAWGGALLTAARRDWSIVPGGAGAVVHAFVARNIVAHGATAYNQTAVNRLNGAAPGIFAIEAGTPFVLPRESFQLHLSRLRNFSRVICGTPSRVRKNSMSRP